LSRGWGEKWSFLWYVDGLVEEKGEERFDPFVADDDGECGDGEPWAVWEDVSEAFEESAEEGSGGHADDGEEWGEEEDEDGIDPAEDGSDAAEEVGIAESHGFLAEGGGAEDSDGPDESGSDEVADD